MLGWPAQQTHRNARSRAAAALAPSTQPACQASALASKQTCQGCWWRTPTLTSFPPSSWIKVGLLRWEPHTWPWAHTAKAAALRHRRTSPVLQETEWQGWGAQLGMLRVADLGTVMPCDLSAGTCHTGCGEESYSREHPWGLLAISSYRHRQGTGQKWPADGLQVSFPGLLQATLCLVFCGRAPSGKGQAGRWEKCAFLRIYIHSAHAALSWTEKTTSTRTSW